MKKPDLAIVIILRLTGVSGMLAIPAIFLPFAWMAAIHEYLGLGTMPDAPIVHYLARSLSAFYAMVGAIMVFVSLDLQRYRFLVKLWAVLICLMGCVLLGIDVSAGMPSAWTLWEGPPTVAVGLMLFWLERAGRNVAE